MTDQPESASEYADLLGNLDPATWDESYNIHKFVAVTMRHAAAAIRTLEAKVRDDEKTMRDMAARWETTIADRDRLDLECARLTLDRDRLAGEVQAERETSARLRGHMFVMEQEDARLTAELAAARVNEAWWQRAVADAYGWLWCVNEEPGTPNRFPAERAAYNARKLLRELLTHEQRGIGINRAVIQRDAARRAGEGEK